jgi:beta-barrel assembly-enhancing protease
MRLARVNSALATLALTGAMACSVSVSDSEEREIGVAMARQVDSVMAIIDDSAVTRFITDLGKGMTSHTSRGDLEWRFRVVNTSEMNAFAIPGGFIYVTRGLIEQAGQYNELAGVMGHEIGHVVRRHSVDQLVREEQRNGAIMLLCTLTRACSTIGGAILVQAGADAEAARYSRKDESEADSEAVVIAVSSDIDPAGLPTFLHRMLESRTEEPTLIDAFFSTHPTDEARITALNRQIAGTDGARENGLIRDVPDFHSIQKRLRAMPPPPRADSTGSAR